LGKIVYAAGVFDCLHYGHMRYLKAAKALGDTLVVGLVEDEGVAKYKSRRPLTQY
jgi:cytidyltransferase-like protein